MALTNKGNFKIGNVEYSPKLNGLKIDYDSIATYNSGRTDDGVMHITFVKNKYITLSVEMPPMSPSDASALISSVQGKIYNITYWDMRTNSEKTTQVYTSKSSGQCYSGVITNGMYQGVSFNAIEVAGENV